jgi:hypothetical protein
MRDGVADSLQDEACRDADVETPVTALSLCHLRMYLAGYNPP